MDESLDALVHGVDEDRWLASRFAPRDVRERLIALYSLNYEIARVAEIVAQGAVGHIRLAWWREALDEILHGAPHRAHPALAAFAGAHRATPFSRHVLEALIDARGGDFEVTPFATWADLDVYTQATAGGLMLLAVQACGGAPPNAATAAFARRAGRIWGSVGLLRAEPLWRARGRQLLPREGGSLEDLRARVASAYGDLQTLDAPPAKIFPAIGYIALIPAYLRRLRTGPSDTALLGRQLRLIAASATGRF